MWCLYNFNNSPQPNAKIFTTCTHALFSSYICTYNIYFLKNHSDRLLLKGWKKKIIFSSWDVKFYLIALKTHTHSISLSKGTICLLSVVSLAFCGKPIRNSTVTFCKSKVLPWVREKGDRGNYYASENENFSFDAVCVCVLLNCTYNYLTTERVTFLFTRRK